MLKVKKSENFIVELLEAGSYPARCYGIIDLGTHLNVKWQKLQRQVRVLFELPTEKRTFKKENGEQPLMMSKNYTLSLNEGSALFKDLSKIFTASELEDFDLEKLIGKEVMLSINTFKTPDGQERNGIIGISKLPKGMVVEPQINKTVKFSFDEVKDLKDFEKKIENFGDYYKKFISESEEAKKLSDKDVENDLPF